jgi:hypothetical protein
MRCLRVRLVTGLSGGLRDQPGRQQDCPARAAQRVVWFVRPPLRVRESSRETQKPRGAPEWRARVRKDTGSALKARTKKRLTRLLGAPPPFGETEKERKGGPALSSTGMRSVGSRGLFDIVKKD